MLNDSRTPTVKQRLFQTVLALEGFLLVFQELLWIENNYTYAYGNSQATIQASTFDLNGGLPSSGKYVDKFDKLR